jgi:hypothetical protein
MTKSEAVLEQIRTLAAELSPEERLSAIRTIVEAAPVASDPVVEEDGLVQRLWVEQEAWFAQPLSVREKYRGQFIAVQHGSVIDHDPDKRALHLRVRREYPGEPIPILDGNWDQVPDLVIRSPRLERIID